MKNLRFRYKIAAFLMALLLVFVASGPVLAYDVKSNYKRVSNTLEKIRGMRFKKPVPYQVKSRDFMKKYLAKLLKKELPPHKVKAFDATLKVFGFVGKDFNTLDFYLKLLGEQVAGLYDYNRQQMFLMNEPVNMKGMEAEMAQMKMLGIQMEDFALIHEMQHALQDQYFNLKNLIGTVEKRGNDDYTNAMQALIEGDATIVMVYHMMRTVAGRMGGDPEMMMQMMDMSQFKQIAGSSSTFANAPAFAGAPLYFKRTLIFPYLDGMIFVDALKKRGGWGKVNQVFKNLPKSTEQILHVESYLGGDNPILVSWKNLPKNVGGWKVIEENTAGELIVKILFEQHLPASNFASVAKGWGGDRYRVYHKGGDNFLVWFTTWDRKQDAKEFFENYKRLLEAKHKGLKWTKKVPGRAYLGRSGNEHQYVCITGKDVVVMEQVPAGLTTKVLQKAWKVNRKVFK